MKTLGIYETLRRRLLQCGLTQEEIAAGSDVAQSTVGRIMRGDTKPTVETADKLIRFLDLLEKAGAPQKVRKLRQRMLEEMERGAA